MNLFNKILISLFIFTGVAIFTSCCKNVDIPVTNCVAGKGGEVRLILFPEHHAEPIGGVMGYPDSAFIKFNANEYPGEDPALYDLVVSGNDSEIYVVIDSLKCGQYYIYMTGFDESIVERVRGGIPFFIEQTTGNVTIKIPVTED